jgi:hypothetical protein
MPAESGAFSYGDSSAKASLWDQIKDLDPEETYLSSTASNIDVTNKIHSWVIDPITATSSQAGVAENTDTSYAATAPTLLFNTTQKIEKGIAVDSTDQATKHAGFSDRFAREQLKKMKEWKQQLEFSAVAGALVSGTGTAARTMAGIVAFASTLATTQGSGVSLNSDMLNSYLGNAWEAGADHDTVLAGRSLKERISMFTAGNTRTLAAGDKRLVAAIDVLNFVGHLKQSYLREVSKIFLTYQVKIERIQQWITRRKDFLVGWLESLTEKALSPFSATSGKMVQAIAL